MNEGHLSREALAAYLGDVEAEEQKPTREHVMNCKSCAERCYFMDPQLNHE